MIDVSSIVNDPLFAQSFTVYRKTGAYVNGVWTPSESAITMCGTITVPKETDLRQLPEGDFQQGAICIYTTQELYLTGTSGTSDEIMWRGNRYRIAQLWPWGDFGYYKAMGVRMVAT